MFGLTAEEKSRLRACELDLQKVFEEIKNLRSRSAGMSRRVSALAAQLEEQGGEYIQEEEEEEPKPKPGTPLERYVQER